MTDSTSVTFVDVAQGDCTIAVDHATGDAILVDCPAGQEQSALSVLDRENATRLHLVVATHSDLDHLGGIFAIASSVPTAEVRVNGAPAVCADADERKQLRAALRAIASLKYRQVRVDRIEAGEEGTVGALSWRVLAPDHAQLLHAQGIGSPNHASVILRLEANRIRFLVAGDADGLSWRGLLETGEDVRAAVFLIPHHGGEMPASRSNAGIAEVLAAVGADIVVLSFGTANRYGHPHISTLEAIASNHVRLASTQAAAPWGALPLAPTWIGTIRCLPAKDGLSISV